MNDRTEEYETFGASRVEVEPGVYRVMRKTPTFYRKIPNKELYRAFVGERIQFENIQGERIGGHEEDLELPGPSYRKAKSEDSEELLARGVTIYDPEDFNPYRLVPVE